MRVKARLSLEGKRSTMTGSRTQGIWFCEAMRAAVLRACTCESRGVPILMRSA